MSTPPYPPSASDGEPLAATATLESSVATDTLNSPIGRAAGIITSAALSALIVIYIALGSITTRFWELDVFQQAWTQKVEPRRVLHVWTYQLDHLPYSSSPTLLKLIFGGALLVVVLGVVGSIWLILCGRANSTAVGSASASPAIDTP
ncbi:MAG: hypothetical protein ACR2OU_09750 [Thermomicrobiales bacterium]